MYHRVYHRVAALTLTISAVMCCITNPPFLYVTYHGGSDDGDINQIYKYSRDGCLLSDTVLESTSDITWDEFRGMTILPSGLLMVNNANKHASKVLAYANCTATDAQRSFVDVVAQGNIDDDSGANPLLVHPYGVVYSADTSEVAISNQDTCSVSAYEIDANGSSTRGERSVSNTYSSKMCDEGDGIAVRGIAFDGAGLLYFAVEEEGIYVLNFTTGEQLTKIACDDCVGVVYDTATDTLFVGSNGEDMIYQFDVYPTLTKIQSIGGNDDDSVLSHPAGMAVYGKSLFVNSQDTNSILEFDITSGAFVRTVLKDAPDKLEALILSPC